MKQMKKRFENSRRAVACLGRLHRALCGQLRGAVDARAITRGQYEVRFDRAQRDYWTSYGTLRHFQTLTERREAEQIEAAMKLLDALGVASEFPSA
jgi:hypothetical protein